MSFSMAKMLVFFWASLFSVNFAHASDSLLQTKKRDIKFAEMLAGLDLTSSNVRFEYRIGSTTVGLKIYRKDKYIAYWKPDGEGQNGSEGQVVSYYLGRFLQMSELVAPSDYIYMPNNHLQLFENFMVNDLNTIDADDNEFKDASNAGVLIKVREHLSSKSPYLGAIVLKMDKFVVDKLVDWEKNQFNKDTQLAHFIRADKPQPSSKKIMNLEEFYPEEGQVNTSTELDLAKELSKIMVLDMLTGQWDRFSGGNLEARFDESDENPLIGKLHFLIRDNGGANMSFGDPSETEFQKYLSIVTRFDKEQVEQVKLLSTLLESDPEMIKNLLRMVSSVDLLKARTKALLEHVDKQVALYGADQAFFPKKKAK